MVYKSVIVIFKIHPACWFFQTFRQTCPELTKGKWLINFELKFNKSLNKVGQKFVIETFIFNKPQTHAVSFSCNGQYAPTNQINNFVRHILCSVFLAVETALKDNVTEPRTTKLNIPTWSGLTVIHRLMCTVHIISFEKDHIICLYK